MKITTFSLFMVLGLSALFGSPWVPPIEDRIQNALAIVEGHLTDTDEDLTKDGFHKFRITKKWRTKLRIGDSIIVRDDSFRDFHIDGMLTIGRGSFQSDVPLVLLLSNYKETDEIEYFQLSVSSKIREVEIADAKRLWGKKKLKQ